MIIKTPKSGVTKNTISIIDQSFIKQGLGYTLILSDFHKQKVNDIRTEFTNPIQEKALSQRTIEIVENKLISYAQNRMKDAIGILSLIIYICDDWNSCKEKPTPTFFQAEVLVELLKTMKSIYYREALLVYQATLFEKSTEPEVLFILPLVDSSPKDEYHALSVFLIGHAYQQIEDYAHALEVFYHIGPDDPLSYQALAAITISTIQSLYQSKTQKSGNKKNCTIF